MNEPKELIVHSVRTLLVPLLIQRGFEIAPLVEREPIDPEAISILPLGRMRRTRERGVDLVQIQFARRQRPAFRIMAGIAPSGGLMTLNGHWAAEDTLVDWLNEYFVVYASRWWRTWFSVKRWHRSVAEDEYQKVALRAALFLPELELALREGRLGPHTSRVVIPRNTAGSTQNKH